MSGVSLRTPTADTLRPANDGSAATASPESTHVGVKFFIVHVAVGHVRELQLALVRLEHSSVI